MANAISTGGGTNTLQALFNNYDPGSTAVLSAPEYPGLRFRLELLVSLLTFHMGSDWVPGVMDATYHVVKDSTTSSTDIKILLPKITLRYEQVENFSQAPTFALDSWGSSGFDAPSDLDSGQLVTMQPPLALHTSGRVAFSMQNIVLDLAPGNTPFEILSQFSVGDDFTGIYIKALQFYYSDSDKDFAFNISVEDALISFQGKVWLEAELDLMFDSASHPNSGGLNVTPKFLASNQPLQANDSKQGTADPVDNANVVFQGGSITAPPNVYIQLQATGGVPPYTYKVEYTSSQAGSSAVEMWDDAQNQAYFTPPTAAPPTANDSGTLVITVTDSTTGTALKYTNTYSMNIAPMQGAMPNGAPQDSAQNSTLALATFTPDARPSGIPDNYQIGFTPSTAGATETLVIVGCPNPTATSTLTPSGGSAGSPQTLAISAAGQAIMTVNAGDSVAISEDYPAQPSPSGTYNLFFNYDGPASDASVTSYTAGTPSPDDPIFDGNTIPADIQGDGQPHMGGDALTYWVKTALDMTQAITITGQASYEGYDGTADHNQALSTQRANVAQAFVKAASSTITNVTATGNGQTQAQSSNSVSNPKDRVAVVTGTAVAGQQEFKLTGTLARAASASTTTPTTTTPPTTEPNTPPVQGSNPNNLVIVPIDTVPVFQFDYAADASTVTSTFTEAVPQCPMLPTSIGCTAVSLGGGRTAVYSLTSLSISAASVGSLSPVNPPLPTGTPAVPLVWRKNTPANNTTATRVDLALFSRDPNIASHALERSTTLNGQLTSIWGGLCDPIAPPACVLWTFCNQPVDFPQTLWNLTGIPIPDPPGTTRTSPVPTAMQVTAPSLANAAALLAALGPLFGGNALQPARVIGISGNKERTGCLRGLELPGIIPANPAIGRSPKSDHNASPAPILKNAEAQQRLQKIENNWRWVRLEVGLSTQVALYMALDPSLARVSFSAFGDSFGLANFNNAFDIDTDLSLMKAANQIVPVSAMGQATAAGLLNYRVKSDVIIRERDASGALLREHTLESLNPNLVIGTIGMPSTWTDPNGPWWEEIAKIATYFNAGLQTLSKVFVQFTPLANTAIVEVAEVGPVAPNRPSVVIGAVQACSQAEQERNQLGLQVQSGPVSTLEGYLDGGSPVPLLIPNTEYTITIEYNVKTTEADGTTVTNYNGVQQGFTFQTDSAPPPMLDPWVLGALSANQEEDVFYDDPVMIAFNDQEAIQLFKAYNEQLVLQLHAADGLNDPSQSVANTTQVSGIGPAGYDSLLNLIQQGLVPCAGAVTSTSTRSTPRR